MQALLDIALELFKYADIGNAISQECQCRNVLSAEGSTLLEQK